MEIDFWKLERFLYIVGIKCWEGNFIAVGVLEKILRKENVIAGRLSEEILRKENAIQLHGRI